MDGVLIAGIITAAIGAVPITIGAVAQLRKAMQPDSDARALVRTIWDLMSAGVVVGIPVSVRSRMRRLLDEVTPDDVVPSDQEERGPAATGRRRLPGDHDHPAGDVWSGQG